MSGNGGKSSSLGCRQNWQWLCWVLLRWWEFLSSARSCVQLLGSGLLRGLCLHTTLWSVLLLLLRSLSLAARKSEPRGVTLHCVSTVSVALGGKMGMTDPGQQELDSCSISPQPTSQLSFQDSIFSELNFKKWQFTLYKFFQSGNTEKFFAFFAGRCYQPHFTE